MVGRSWGDVASHQRATICFGELLVGVVGASHSDATVYVTQQRSPCTIHIGTHYKLTMLSYGMGIQWKRVSCVYIPSILYSGKRQGALEKWIDSATFCVQSLLWFFSEPEPPHCTPVPRNLVIYNSTFLSSAKTRCFWKYQQFDSGSSIVSKVLNATLSTCRGLSSVWMLDQIIASNKLGHKQKVHSNNMCPFSIMWFHWILSAFF
jgi:hypothetical protein